MRRKNAYTIRLNEENTKFLQALGFLNQWTSRPKKGMNLSRFINSLIEIKARDFILKNNNIKMTLLETEMKRKIAITEKNNEDIEEISKKIKEIIAENGIQG